MLKADGGYDNCAIAYDSEYAAHAAQGRRGKTNHKLIDTAQRLLKEERERRVAAAEAAGETEKPTIQFVHVFAHTGQVWNEHTDLLVQYGKGNIKIDKSSKYPQSKRVPWTGASTSRLHIGRDETTAEKAQRQQARRQRADHQREHVNDSMAAAGKQLPELPVNLTCYNHPNHPRSEWTAEEIAHKAEQEAREAADRARRSLDTTALENRRIVSAATSPDTITSTASHTTAEHTSDDNTEPILWAGRLDCLQHILWQRHAHT